MFSTEDRVDILIFYILVTKFYLQITHIKFSKEKCDFCGKSDRIFFFFCMEIEIVSLKYVIHQEKLNCPVRC